jgi:hypothetical protein
MRNSCAAINRILDPNNTSVTLTTLSNAHSLGRKLKIGQTSHVHVPRIVAALMGRRVEVADGPGGQLTAVVF